MSTLNSRYAFPAAASINFFSITALLVVAGITGKEVLAAEIGVLQAAIAAVFLSLSGNARSIILSGSHGRDERDIFAFRMLVLPLAVIVAYVLIEGAVEVPGLLIFSFIVRKCSEWFTELQLAGKERDGDYRFVSAYVLVNLLLLLLLMLFLILSLMQAFYLALLVWASVPFIFSASYVARTFDPGVFKTDYRAILPNIGSSAIIGLTTYIFRLVIIYLVGKGVAGQLFSAYAIGGVISALYTQAFGPSILLRSAARDFTKTFGFALLWVVVGAAMLSAMSLMSIRLSASLLPYGIGLSMIGGGLMVLAQRQKLYILQVLKKDVFVVDSLANMILLMSVPLVYFIFGEGFLVGMFLWSAILNGFFYLAVMYRERSICEGI